MSKVVVSVQSAGGNAPVEITIRVSLTETDAKLAPDFTGFELWEGETPEDQPLLGCRWGRIRDDEPSDLITPTGGLGPISFQVGRSAWDAGMRSNHFMAGEEAAYLKLWADDFAGAISKARAILPISVTLETEV